jgi:hypothetical protein
MGSVQAGILKLAIAASATLFATAASAQVVYTDWFGGGVLTSATTCPNGNLESHVNRVFTVRYLPAGIGDNGANSSISILSQHFAQGYVTAGNFSTTIPTATSSQTIARFAGPSGYMNGVRVAITKQTPLSITASTPMINMTIKIIGFTGFPNNQNCTAIINATVFRP